jgi:hypothetical protein
MAFPANPEVLSADWTPTQLVHREPERHAARALLLAAEGSGLRAIGPLVVEGPPGSGTSALIRVLARDVQEDVRRRSGVVPRILPVRVRWSTGTTGVAAHLLQQFDEGFRAQGFSVAEIMAGVLRRAQREGRPLIVVLDDVAPGAPDLIPIVHALRHPERFLPEGVEHAVPCFILVATASEAEGFRRGWTRSGGVFLGPIRLSEYRPLELREIVFDRARRTLGMAPEEALVGSIVHRSLSEGRGASRAIELLRDALHPQVESVAATAGILAVPPTLFLEPRMAEALAGACASGPASLGDLRAWEERLALKDGVPPLAPTTLWRRLVRLEQAGIVRREVRSGGPGGSHSTIRLLRPASHLAEITHPPMGTPRGFEGRPGGGLRPGPGRAWGPARFPVGPGARPGPRPPVT